jgi:hypothetical protein
MSNQQPFEVKWYFPDGSLSRSVSKIAGGEAIDGK